MCGVWCVPGVVEDPVRMDGEGFEDYGTGAILGLCRVRVSQSKSQPFGVALGIACWLSLDLSIYEVFNIYWSYLQM